MLFAEGICAERLPAIADDDLSHGSVMWWFDATDMTAAKGALGGEVSWGMGEGEDQEILTLTKTTAIYVPANLPQAPQIYNRVDRPILNIAIGPNTGDYA